MELPNLSLNDVVNVVVDISPVSAVRAGFNLALILGDSAVIELTDRVKTYTSTLGMIDDGFSLESEEYKAATLYFSQSPRPTRVAIGVKDAGETVLQAITACRSKNTEWYACTYCGAVKADIISIAGFIETAVPNSAYFYSTADADVKTGVDGNVIKSIKALNYKRTLGMYSATPDAAAAIMGYAMGANVGTANSAYTLAYKRLVGVATDALSDTEVGIIKGVNGNVYINRGSSYDVFEKGVVADGTPFDEIINLDVLVDDIQKSVMDALMSGPKVPQTEDGMGILISAVNGPCSKARTKGFLAPGQWNAPGILNVETGDTLSNGYIVLAETIASQTQADRDARKAPPIYALIKLAGAIEHVVVQIKVNR